MTGGTILVHGDVGSEIGHGMRRGLLAVAGNAGDLIGFNMLAGSIFVFGNSGIRHGASMRRGTIGLFGSEPLTLLPTFRRACQGRFEFLRLVDRVLQRHGFPAPLRWVTPRSCCTAVICWKGDAGNCWCERTTPDDSLEQCGPEQACPASSLAACQPPASQPPASAYSVNAATQFGESRLNLPGRPAGGRRPPRPVDVCATAGTTKSYCSSVTGRKPSPAWRATLSMASPQSARPCATAAATAL